MEPEKRDENDRTLLDCRGIKIILVARGNIVESLIAKLFELRDTGVTCDPVLREKGGLDYVYSDETDTTLVVFAGTMWAPIVASMVDTMRRNQVPVSVISYPALPFARLTYPEMDPDETKKLPKYGDLMDLITYASETEEPENVQEEEPLEFPFRMEPIEG